MDYSLLLNQSFHEWTVKKIDEEKTKTGIKLIYCACSCGKEKYVRYNDLVLGKSTNCGCKNLEKRWQDTFKKFQSKFFKFLTLKEIDWELTKQNQSLYIKCLCSCGKEKSISIRCLKSETASCGNCWRRRKGAEKFLDSKIDELTIISINWEKTYQEDITYLNCFCSCGVKCIKSLDSFRNKHSNPLSCGCKNKQNTLPKQIGQVFGDFLVISENKAEQEIRESSHKILNCSCIYCGKNKKISTSHLTKNSFPKCSCQIASIGEKKIMSLLEENNIFYEYDKNFSKDLVSLDGFPLRCDFILYFNDLPIRIIEYDGEQHFRPIEKFGGEKEFLKIRERDKIKDEYFLKKQIPLIRIPYTLNKITIEDLMTDKYRKY